ncbi:MAG: 16S rRNA (guanine(966)-N(2))-methyltransferase RsmD [Helicobacteraceae bacterium]|jgi:16S rRNA (guanine(966)-N(2))-methyltransferase RsmD|nr:16S rRNA (guanine(966)-N(2))-methyltransferase RsmD [Helicobacteraceae bacterium]
MRNNKDFNYARVIAGSLKGRKIAMPKFAETRPTKAIVRESLFSTIAFEIEDSVFIEVFAGSGSVGIEAISRGAKKAIFLEQNPEAIKIINENLNSLKITNFEIIRGDSFEIFGNLIKTIETSQKNAIFYFDPPFLIRENFLGIYDRVTNLINQIPRDLAKLIIIEHLSDHKFPSKIAEFSHSKTAKFGKTSISYFRT